MILDNSGIYYSLMLLFVLGFLVYWKIEKILEPSATPVVYDIITKLSRQSCQKKQNVTSKQINF